MASVGELEQKQTQREATKLKKLLKVLGTAFVLIVVGMGVWIMSLRHGKAVSDAGFKTANMRHVTDTARIKMLADSLELERHLSANRQIDINAQKAEISCLVALAAFGNQDDKIHPTSRLRIRVRKPYSAPIKPVPTAVDRLAFAATADSCPARLEKLVAKNRDARALLAKARADSSRFKQEPPHK
jgi:hypothetical protein